jgi:hypothetical protein
MATKILGVLSTVFIIGFLAFGFRQGFRQKAAARKDRGAPSPGDSP